MASEIPVPLLAVHQDSLMAGHSNTNACRASEQSARCLAFVCADVLTSTSLALDEIQQPTDPCCRQSLELKLEDISQCFFFFGGGEVAIYESDYSVTNSFMLLIQDCTLKTNAWMYGSATCTWLEIAGAGNPRISSSGHHRVPSGWNGYHDLCAWGHP